jgi:hypothetical protein
MTLAILLASASAFARDPAVDRIQRQFDAAKPTDKSLAFYSLDWAVNLREAKQLAAAEQRPIFLILNTNITAGTNLYSGHT